ncbi:hypothetical protein IF2G_02447 [Cordyceps javanica]|nr:hypothetical protein IF2G_02447 [Cordyceps javanica]
MALSVCLCGGRTKHCRLLRDLAGLAAEPTKLGWLAGLVICKVDHLTPWVRSRLARKDDEFACLSGQNRVKKARKRKRTSTKVRNGQLDESSRGRKLILLSVKRQYHAAVIRMGQRTGCIEECRWAR